MSKTLLIATSALFLLAAQSDVDAAWKSKSSNKKTSDGCDTNKPMPMGMYHYDDRGSFVELEYLFWLPHQEDLFYGLKINATNANASGSFKQPRYDLSSGVRVSFGGFNTDHWDIGLTGMYIYSEGKDKTSSNGNLFSNNNNGGGSGIVPEYNTGFYNEAITANAKLRLNLFVPDFAIGREFFLTRRFALHPFIGLRGFALYEAYNVKYYAMQSNTAGNSPNQITITDLSDVYFKSHEQIYGIGPRAGVDLSFYVSTNWAFLGGISGSFLLSQYHTKIKYEGVQFNDTSSGGVPSGNYSPLIIKTKDGALFLRTNLDGYFGIGWDHWYNCDKNRVHVALVFEASEWFGMNQQNDLLITNGGGGGGGNGPGIIPEFRRHGDLGFIGGTFSVKFDF